MKANSLLEWMPFCPKLNMSKNSIKKHMKGFQATQEFVNLTTIAANMFVEFGSEYRKIF